MNPGKSAKTGERYRSRPSKNPKNGHFPKSAKFGGVPPGNPQNRAKIRGVYNRIKAKMGPKRGQNRAKKGVPGAKKGGPGGPKSRKWGQKREIWGGPGPQTGRTSGRAAEGGPALPFSSASGVAAILPTYGCADGAVSGSGRAAVNDC